MSFTRALTSASRDVRHGLVPLGLVLMLTGIATVGCGGPAASSITTPSPTPTTAASTPTLPPATPTPAATSISGTVVGDDGQPMFALGENELLMVILLCGDGPAAVRCLPEITQDMNFDAVRASVCDSVDTTVCPVSLGQGAAMVDSEGSFALTDIAPGTYGVVLLYQYVDGAYLVGGYQIERNVAVIEGVSAEIEFALDFHRA
jgi:hypothetical protein